MMPSSSESTYAWWCAFLRSIRLAISPAPGIALSDPLRCPACRAAIIAGMNGCGSARLNEPKSVLNAVRLMVSIVSFVMSAETSTGPVAVRPSCRTAPARPRA